MKKVFFLTFVLLFCCVAFSQELVAHHGDKGLYVVHTVTSKENFYSLGRLYNVPPKEIAAFNGLEMEKGLSIGQTVNVPLTAQNFSQQSSTAHPVYYVVGEKEGLYRVSVNNNKVLMANLRKWNDLKSDAVTTGQRLIVGYLVSNDAGVANITRQNTPETQDVTKKPEEKPIQKEEEQKPVQKTEPMVTEKKQEQPKIDQPKSEQPKSVTASVNDGNGGYFKTAFESQVKTQPSRKEEMATAGIFKTASGWQDAKYYALIDGVEPGTIIRVINPNNNKAVYAKVLDKMTGIRQNQGYDVRISNAAATALDISETDKFFVRVNY